MSHEPLSDDDLRSLMLSCLGPLNRACAAELLDRRHRDRLVEAARTRAGVSASLTMEAAVAALAEQRDKAVARIAELEHPIHMILYCPMCHTRHVDEGSQMTTPHRTHACQNPRCGHLWAPAVVATVGVWTLPGCLNPVESLPLEKAHSHDWRPLNPAISLEACHTCSAERIHDFVRGYRYRTDSTSAWVDNPESALTRHR